MFRFILKTLTSYHLDAKLLLLFRAWAVRTIFQQCILLYLSIQVTKTAPTAQDINWLFMVFRLTSVRNLVSSWTGGGRLRQFDYCICQRQPMHNWGVKCQRGPFELLQNMICTNRNPFFYLHHSQALQPKLLISKNYSYQLKYKRQHQNSQKPIRERWWSLAIICIENNFHH